MKLRDSLFVCCVCSFDQILIQFARMTCFASGTKYEQFSLHDLDGFVLVKNHIISLICRMSIVIIRIYFHVHNEGQEVKTYTCIYNHM